jgi:hypothetical protein
LTKRLAEIDEKIEKFNKEIYKGKLEKAIKLLEECNEYFGNPLIMTNELGCEVCDTVSIGRIHCNEIVDGLNRFKCLYFLMGW